jgi:Adenylosuccinate synthetase
VHAVHSGTELETSTEPGTRTRDETRGVGMSAVVIVGAQWGDAGKGKIIDI